MSMYSRGSFRAVRGIGNGALIAGTGISQIVYPIVALGMPVGVAVPHDNNTGAGLWGAWTQICLAVAAPAVEYWLAAAQILATAAAITDAHALQIGSGLAATPPTALFNAVDPLAPLDGAAGAVNTVTFNPHYAVYPIYQAAATPISGQSAVTTKVAAANVTMAVYLVTGL